MNYNLVIIRIFLPITKDPSITLKNIPIGNEYKVFT